MYSSFIFRTNTLTYIQQGPTNTFIFWCPFGTLASKFWRPGSQIQWPEKRTESHHNTFFVRAIGVSHHGMPHPRKFFAPRHGCSVETERIDRDASRIHFGVLCMPCIILCFLFLVSLSPVFVRFPPHVKIKLIQTHFNGS